MDAVAAPEPIVARIPEPENHLYYPALNGFRAVAVILVFLQHYVLPARGPALQWGWVGVDAFFVLSGFLITGILYDTRDHPRRFKVFFTRRALRIFPLYYGVLLLTVLLTPVGHWIWTSRWLLWPVYLGNYVRLVDPTVYPAGLVGPETLRSASGSVTLYFGHFWSLCVEEQFYLVWPFVVFAIRDRKRLRNLCLATVALMPLVRCAALVALSPGVLAKEVLYRSTPFRVDALLLGGAIALMLRGPEGERLRQAALPLAAACAMAWMATYGITVQVLHQSGAGTPTVPWISSVGFSIVDLFFAAILLLSLQPGTVVYRVLTIRSLRQLGEISYGFYVFHDLPHVLYDKIGRMMLGRYTSHVGVLAAPIAFVATTLVAWLSFRYFESPFLRLKDRFTN